MNRRLLMKLGDAEQIVRCVSLIFLWGIFWIFHYLIQHYFTCSARKWRSGSNSERKLWTRFEFADFFLVRAVSLFTLRTFGAQINWRVISRKVLFDPHRFLSNQITYSFCWRERKRKYVSQWQTARSKWKWTSIATVPLLCPATVKILTHLISRYHLPLR